jgi:hypothetical protein
MEPVFIVEQMNDDNSLVSTATGYGLTTRIRSSAQTGIFILSPHQTNFRVQAVSSRRESGRILKVMADFHVGDEDDERRS